MWLKGTGGALRLQQQQQQAGRREEDVGLYLGVGRRIIGDVGFASLQHRSPPLGRERAAQLLVPRRATAETGESAPGGQGGEPRHHQGLALSTCCWAETPSE